MSHNQTTPKNNKQRQRQNFENSPPSLDDLFSLANPSPNRPMLRPPSFYCNQPYPNQPYRNPTPARAPEPFPYVFTQFSQNNPFQDFSSQPPAFPFNNPNYVTQTQMGGSSSQPPMSPIHSFQNEELYSPQFSEDMSQNPPLEDDPVEVIPPPRATATRRKKRANKEKIEVPRCTAWTQEEEIALCKAWVHVSENSSKGNDRNTDGFWTEVLDYFHKKTNCDKRTYDMLNGKWKTIRPNVAKFCGVYANVQRRAQESGAGDEDYFNKALLDFEAEFSFSFTQRHCWELLKDSPKWKKSVLPKYSQSKKKSKTSDSSSYNVESGEASINLNVAGEDEDENEVEEIPRPIGRDRAKSKKKGAGSSGSSVQMNDEALVKMMVSELATQTANLYAQKKDERVAFYEMKQKEMQLRQQEIELQLYRQRQEDMRFYMQPYEHLTGVQRTHMDAMRAEIKAKYNLPY